jgi:hypothetical protein
MIATAKKPVIETTHLAGFTIVKASYFDRDALQLTTVIVELSTFKNGDIGVYSEHAEPNQLGGWDRHAVKHHRGPERDVTAGVIAIGDTIRIQYKNRKLYVNAPKRWTIEVL